MMLLSSLEKFAPFPAIGEPCKDETSKFSEKAEFPDEWELESDGEEIWTFGLPKPLKNVEIIVKKYTNKFLKLQNFEFTIRFDSRIWSFWK